MLAVPFRSQTGQETEFSTDSDQSKSSQQQVFWALRNLEKQSEISVIFHFSLCTRVDPSAPHVQGPVIPGSSRVTWSADQSHLTCYCFPFSFQWSIAWLHLSGQRSQRAGPLTLWKVGDRAASGQQRFGRPASGQMMKRPRVQSVAFDLLCFVFNGLLLSNHWKQPKGSCKDAIICKICAKYVWKRNNFQLQN